MKDSYRDPVWDGPNWYAYVGNDPVNFIDPLGLIPETPGNGKAEEPDPLDNLPDSKQYNKTSIDEFGQMNALMSFIKYIEMKNQIAAGVEAYNVSPEGEFGWGGDDFEVSNPAVNVYLEVDGEKVVVTQAGDELVVPGVGLEFSDNGGSQGYFVKDTQSFGTAIDLPAEATFLGATFTATVTTDTGSSIEINVGVEK